MSLCVCGAVDSQWNDELAGGDAGAQNVRRGDNKLLLLFAGSYVRTNSLKSFVFSKLQDS